MREWQCQVAVVGAGPAGSSAARAAARLGADTLLLERRPVVGVPVRCAEFIPAALVGRVDVGGDYIVQRTRGMRTYLAGTQIQELSAPGCIIRRDMFDQALAAAAVTVGTRLQTGTAVAARDGDAILARQGGETVRIRAQIIIGADGPQSVVGRWMGSPNRRCVPGVQVRVRLAQPLDHTEIYFDEDIPAGYAWLFPRGQEANVGLGMRPQGAGHLRHTLAEFLQFLRARGRITGAPGQGTAGWIPAEKPRAMVRGHMLLAGDAAGHTHAITGAGVFQAVVAGEMAGTWAARAALGNDLSLLRHYGEEWEESYGETLAHAASRRDLLENHTGPLADIIRRCWTGFREYHARA